MKKNKIENERNSLAAQSSVRINNLKRWLKRQSLINWIIPKKTAKTLKKF